MSVVRFIPQVNRLAKAMKGPGGKKVSEAVADAEAALQEIAPPSLEALDAALADIVVQLQPPGLPSKAVRAAIYRRANEINALGGLFGLADMGRAAWSLCELIDIAEAGPPSTRAAMDAHVRSLRLLRAGDALPEDERKAVLEGLDKVLAHVRSEAG